MIPDHKTRRNITLTHELDERLEVIAKANRVQPSTLITAALLVYLQHPPTRRQIKTDALLEVTPGPVEKRLEEIGLAPDRHLRDDHVDAAERRDFAKGL